MTSEVFGGVALAVLAIVAAGHIFGHVAVALRQPQVVGQLLAGVILGPEMLGRIAPAISTSLGVGAAGAQGVVVGFLYQLGLVLLMFSSGTETTGLFGRENRREVAWLGAIGTGLPFLAVMAAATVAPLDSLLGPAGHRPALVMVLGIAVAVTSIPFISQIFHDLGIQRTRFARLVLGVAVVEDVILWAVLAATTSLVAAGTAGGGAVGHLSRTVGFFAVGLLLMPRVMQAVTSAPWNVLARTSPLAYIVLVLLGYTALAAVTGVSLVFAAFLAGYALTHDSRLAEATSTLGRVGFAMFVPIYFVMVGFQLQLSRGFSLWLLLAFLVPAVIVKVLAGLAGARAAGFGWSASMNLAIALNARGGPGIVLATVAWDAGIVSAEFYTALVLTAVATTQFSGVWLGRLVRLGRPLLPGSGDDAGGLAPTGPGIGGGGRS
ncbi:MAG: cation:proton antiporter [Acidimicrobiia bacterium]|nr:cation:proton antiporter [Acidimicrobiia bacterium]